MPEIVINLKTRILPLFEENFENLGNLPFASYFDFETTTGTISGNHLEYEKMYPIPYSLTLYSSYSLILAFHPKLNSIEYW